MSGRAGQLGAAEQFRIGRQVLRLRAEGELWKQLAFRFNRSAEQLRRYARRVQRQTARCQTSALASATPRVKEWPMHDPARVLPVLTAPAPHREAAHQPARRP